MSNDPYYDDLAEKDKTITEKKQKIKAMRIEMSELLIMTDRLIAIDTEMFKNDYGAIRINATKLMNERDVIRTKIQKYRKEYQ